MAVIFTIFTLSMVLSLGTAAMFDYHFVSSQQNFTASETLCQSLGYDGLAVPTSPEMYSYALRITERWRKKGNSSHTYGVFLGLRNNSETQLVTWDDGTFPAEDTIWWNKRLGTNFIGRPYGSIHYLGSVRSTFVSATKYALCGYHNNLPTEAYGVNTPGQRATGVSSILSLTTVPSYLECVLLCGQEYRCRAAEFNSEELTCMILGPGSYTGFTPSFNTQVFVRNGFSLG